MNPPFTAQARCRMENSCLVQLEGLTWASRRSLELMPVPESRVQHEFSIRQPILVYWQFVCIISVALFRSKI